MIISAPLTPPTWAGTVAVLGSRFCEGHCAGIPTYTSQQGSREKPKAQPCHSWGTTRNHLPRAIALTFLCPLSLSLSALHSTQHPNRVSCTPAEKRWLASIAALSHWRPVTCGFALLWVQRSWRATPACPKDATKVEPLEPYPNPEQPRPRPPQKCTEQSTAESPEQEGHRTLPGVQDTRRWHKEQSAFLSGTQNSTRSQT